MAKKGIVFVTINYRLGVFGFYSHPELTKESGHNASGNYGILDQIAALQWIQRNIGSFGGDPANVTIAGQSAGSMSVNILDASPLAKGLFAKIIAESGATTVMGEIAITFPLDAAEISGLQLEKLVGASDLSGLRNTPAENILSAYQEQGISPTRIPIVDGYVLPESIPSIFAGNKQTDVPLLTGFNEDDIVFHPISTVDYLHEHFGESADTLLTFYPIIHNDEINQEAADNFLRDTYFGVQNYSWALIQSEQGKAYSYQYFFCRKVPRDKAATDRTAHHSAEVPYAYDNLKFFDHPLEEADYELAKLMSSYWANFARNGDPNGEGLPYWPAFNKETGEVMIFDTISVVKRHPFYDGLQLLYEIATRQ